MYPHVSNENALGCLVDAGWNLEDALSNAAELFGDSVSPTVSASASAVSPSIGVPAEFLVDTSQEELDIAKAQQLSLETLAKEQAISGGGVDKEAYYEHLLNSRGLKSMKIAMDGNCMFSAVAGQLYGDVEQHSLIRSTVSHVMSLDYEQYVGKYTNEDEDVDTYYQRISKEKEWGDDLELKAISVIYNTKVEVSEGCL